MKTFSFVLNTEDSLTAYKVKAKDISDAVLEFIKEWRKDHELGRMTVKELRQMHTDTMKSKYEEHTDFWTFTFDGDMELCAHQI